MKFTVQAELTFDLSEAYRDKLSPDMATYNLLEASEAFFRQCVGPVGAVLVTVTRVNEPATPTSPIRCSRYAMTLEERQTIALEQAAQAQRTVSAIAEAKSHEGTPWQKFWYGQNGGAGAQSRHERMQY